MIISYTDIVIHFDLYLLRWGSTVGVAIATGRTFRGSKPGGGEILRAVQSGPGNYPASHCTMGIGSFLGIKRPERGADHSPFSSAGLRVVWSCTFDFRLYLHTHVME